MSGGSMPMIGFRIEFNPELSGPLIRPLRASCGLWGLVAQQTFGRSAQPTPPACVDQKCSPSAVALRR